MFGSLRKALSGALQELDVDEDGAGLLAPTDLRTVLANHRAGQDPPISSDQKVVLFSEGQDLRTETVQTAHLAETEATSLG